MVDRGTGRTHRAEAGQRRGQTRPLAESEDGEVRPPRSPLGLVHADPVQPRMQRSGELARRVVHVVEDEHPDARGLAVVSFVELDRPRFVSRGFELGPDRLDIGSGPRSEEGEGEMEILARHEPMAPRRKERLPGDEPVEHVSGQREGAEEPNGVTSPDASSGVHTRS
jgi:hypothetical protein